MRSFPLILSLAFLLVSSSQSFAGPDSRAVRPLTALEMRAIIGGNTYVGDCAPTTPAELCTDDLVLPDCKGTIPNCTGTHDQVVPPTAGTDLHNYRCFNPYANFQGTCYQQQSNYTEIRHFMCGANGGADGDACVGTDQQQGQDTFGGTRQSVTGTPCP